MDVINRNIISYIGQEFDTLAHRTGRPAITVTNRKAFSNYTIQEGSLTSSNHLPIILKLSTKPVIKDSKMCRDFRRANWKEYRNQLELKFRNCEAEDPLQNTNPIDKDKIDVSMTE